MGEWRELHRSPKTTRFVILLFSCLAAFFLGKHWSDGSTSHLLFYSPNPLTSNANSTTDNLSFSPEISISPNANLTLNISDIIVGSSSPPPPPPPSPPPPTPATSPPPPPPERFGVVDEMGVMRGDFAIGDFDPDLVEQWNMSNDDPDNLNGKDGGSVPHKSKRVKRYELCPESMREYIPCLDNAEAIVQLQSTKKGERFERHCPPPEKGLACLIPAPRDYKTPIPWPRSRDEVWYSNVPHTRLVEDKGGQNWITKEKDKFTFPGGGTQFIHGANQYLDQISKMVPEIAFGQSTRVALDVGCGVASFGAFLLSRNVITLSIAPKDVHENQIQFALERGVPAMVAAFATRRLLYPSQAFDFIHCSRCRIDWTRDDGILLLEVNRMLRAGGYFAWAAQPVYKHEEAQQELWKAMEDITARLCWQLLKKEGYIAIWQKPLNNTCYISRDDGIKPPLCALDDDPNDVWYVNLTACITRLPENSYGATVAPWPARLLEPPERLQDVRMDAYISKNELFKADTKFWNEELGTFIHVFRWKEWNLRNVMDMRAGYGGFAAALNDHKLDCWVMNVVPISGPNTLPVIYDRGLIGVMHDWCEPFDTYPRTYDLLHAAGLFSRELKRCDMSVILLEMDRILRPSGHVYIRDVKPIIYEIKVITDAIGWRCDIRETTEGPYDSRKVLMCLKDLPPL